MINYINRINKSLRRQKMVIKMDKSEEFAKSGKKLISEYDADAYFEEKEEEKPQFLKEGE